ncbi:MAG: hypothetical protein DRJ46_04915 [Thermoprotei archaeon]|nr:MAG: hypothetical protein DRJ46_04915 [Thermoprotei archaeon]
MGGASRSGAKRSGGLGSPNPYIKRRLSLWEMAAFKYDGRQGVAGKDAPQGRGASASRTGGGFYKTL